MPTTSLKLDTDRDEQSEDLEIRTRGVRKRKQQQTKRMNTVPLAAGSTECDSGIRRVSLKHEVS